MSHYRKVVPAEPDRCQPLPTVPLHVNWWHACSQDLCWLLGWGDWEMENTDHFYSWTPQEKREFARERAEALGNFMKFGITKCSFGHWITKCIVTWTRGWSEGLSLLLLWEEGGGHGGGAGKKKPKQNWVWEDSHTHSASSVATVLSVLLACNYRASESPLGTRCFNALCSELSFRLGSFKGVFSLIKSSVV